jgi:hypothetical protein
VLVLRRAKDAIAEGDPIKGIIRQEYEALVFRQFYCIIGDILLEKSYRDIKRDLL